MPAQPAYFHKLEEAIEAFRSLPGDWIDRRTLQETLGVSKTVAWRIFRQCGAAEGPGSSLVCKRDELIRSLERIRQTGECGREVARRDRVERHLESLASAARSRHIRVASDERALALVGSRFASLPLGVELTPRRLGIDFSGMDDFLKKVGAVVYALQNDYDAVSRFVENSG